MQLPESVVTPREDALRWIRAEVLQRPALAIVLGSFLLSRLLLLLPTCAVALARRESPLGVWNEWDTHWYLGIAAHGYNWEIRGHPAVAFFPLYPLLLHFGMRLGLPGMVAGLLVSNAAFVGALFYLYTLLEAEWGHAVAGRAIWLVALFPTAFFTFAPYSEALFLLCAAGALYHARNGHPLATGAWAMAAILTRSTGIILLPAIIAALGVRNVHAWLRAVVLPVAGLILYLFYLQGDHLQPGALFHAQRAWHRAFTLPWTGFLDSEDWIVHHWWQHVPWAAENISQDMVTVLFLAITVLAWRFLHRDAALYCAAFWLLVLSTPEWMDGYYAPFSSMDRFILTLFPLAGWAAWHLHGHRFRVVLAVSTILMIGAASLHLAGGWVG